MDRCARVKRMRQSPGSHFPPRVLGLVDQQTGPFVRAMRKFLPSHRSRLATFSLRTARLGVPVIVLSVLAHRLDLVSTPQFLLLLATGSVIALIAVAGALFALARLWARGGHGWGRALRGTVYALIALIPLGAATAAYITHPQLSDISTDTENPPALGSDMPDTIPAEAAALQAEFYPDLVSRRFRILPSELHKAALTVAEQRGWMLTAELPPGMPDEPTRFQAVATSPLYGFRDDVAVRILPDPVGARLDIRSASQVGLHDLGANARRIRGFFADLDAILLAAYGVIEAVDEDEAVTAPEELPPLDPNASAPSDMPPPVPGFKPRASEPATSEEDTRLPGATVEETTDGLEQLPPDLSEIYEEDAPAPGATTAPPADENPPETGAESPDGPPTSPRASGRPARLRPVAGQ